MDLPTAAPPAPPAAAAPAAAPPVAAPAVAESSPSAEASSPPETSSSPKPVEASEAPKFVDPFEKFDFDSWDGSLDAIEDENARMVAERFHGYYSPKIDEMKSSLDRLSLWYDELGREDPDVTAKIEAQAAEFAKEREAWAQERAKWDEQRAEWDAIFEKDAQDYSKWFWEQNEDIAKDTKLRGRFTALAEAGFDLEEAAELSRMPDEAVQRAAEALGEGANSKLALKYAKAYYQNKPDPAAEPSDSALLVDDGGTRQTPSDTRKTMGDVTSLSDMRNLAITRALKAHGLPTG